jgi:hypothetical protein
MNIETLKRVLETLELCNGASTIEGYIIHTDEDIGHLRKVIQEEALRNVQRIGQEIEQEPVAWMDSSGHPKHLRHIQSSEERRLYGELQPLYLHSATTCSGCGESSTKDGFLATYCLKCCEVVSDKPVAHAEVFDFQQTLKPDEGVKT